MFRSSITVMGASGICSSHALAMLDAGGVARDSRMQGEEQSDTIPPKMRILRCRFPFPDQEPPVRMPEPCSDKCPNYDAETLRRHNKIKRDDRELQDALRSFANWFYEPGQDLEEQIRFAAELYTREDHSGTCIPKTILFMHYKHLQFSSYKTLTLSEKAKAAIKGAPAASWPDGEPASGATTWNQMFASYSHRYDSPDEPER